MIIKHNVRKMASNYKTTIIIFEYYTDLSESDGCIERKCSWCGIKLCYSSLAMDRNRIMYRKHPAKYNQIQKGKKLLVTLTLQSLSCIDIKLIEMAACSSAPSKVDRNRAQQKAVTDAIVKMIVKDLQLAYTVEREGFMSWYISIGASLHHGLWSAENTANPSSLLLFQG